MCKNITNGLASKKHSRSKITKYLTSNISSLLKYLKLIAVSTDLVIVLYPVGM